MNNAELVFAPLRRSASTAADTIYLSPPRKRMCSRASFLARLSTASATRRLNDKCAADFRLGNPND
jgi:hypothetical protein